MSAASSWLRSPLLTNCSIFILAFFETGARVPCVALYWWPLDLDLDLDLECGEWDGEWDLCPLEPIS